MADRLLFALLCSWATAAVGQGPAFSLEFAADSREMQSYVVGNKSGSVLRNATRAVSISSQAVTSGVENIPLKTHTIAMPYFPPRIACWDFHLDTSAFANGSAYFTTLLASEGGISLRAYATARKIRDDHTSDGRPCALWESDLGSNPKFNVTSKTGFCVAPRPDNGTELELIRSYRLVQSSSSVTNMTVELVNITHDERQIDGMLKLFTTGCANLTQAAPGPVSVQTDAVAVAGPEAFSFAYEAAGTDADFLRLAHFGANVKAADALPGPILSSAPDSGIVSPKNLELRANREEEEREAYLTPADLLPESFDARDAWPQCDSIRSVRNQGVSCGSCWAHGAVESLTDRTCIENAKHQGSNFSLSVQYLLDCDKTDSACMGGYLDLAWRFLKAEGTCLDSCLPYLGRQQSRCEKVCDGDNKTVIDGKTKWYAASAYPVSQRVGDVVTMQRELVTFGPFESVFWVYDDFSRYTSGTYIKSPKANGPVGGHAVKIIGYGIDENQVPYWTVANSAGLQWGMGGFFRIQRGTNECGFETIPTAGAPGKH